MEINDSMFLKKNIKKPKVIKEKNEREKSYDKWISEKKKLLASKLK